MRIAQVAPLFESVPPKLHGGTGRIVHFLTEELVRAGHDVTLFASGDSLSSARLVPVCERALRLDGRAGDGILEHILAIERAVQHRAQFDVIHFHTASLHFPTSRHLSLPHVTTLHGRLDHPKLQPLYREFADLPFISVSHAQRMPLPDVHWLGNVYHGIPSELLRFSAAPSGGDGYLAFLGRLSPGKRPDRAIAIASASGMRLRIAAKIDAADLDYFKNKLAPLLDPAHVDFVGEIGDDAKSEFIGNARALLFPVDLPEPFGLVLIEAMACGTPVVAFRCGSVPEIVVDGVTGFIVDTVEEAVAAVRRADTLSRHKIREVFEARFSARRMALEYLRLYQEIDAEHRRGATLRREATNGHPSVP